MMRKGKNMNFFNGDIYDIGQTVNGISKFIVIDGKWHYYSERLMREYEYSQEDLDKMIYTSLLNEDEEVKYLGNIFSYIEEG